MSGMYILGWFENGIRMLSNNKHPVTCPDDMKGLKIRVMDSPIYIEMFTEMGASPTPMAYSEVYTALQQGTVDGQDNPYSIFVSTKYYEVQQYFTDLSHTFDFTAFFMSNDFLMSLNDATRELFIECGKECTEYQHQVSQEDELLTSRPCSTTALRSTTCLTKSVSCSVTPSLASRSGLQTMCRAL